MKSLSKYKYNEIGYAELSESSFSDKVAVWKKYLFWKSTYFESLRIVEKKFLRTIAVLNQQVVNRKRQFLHTTRYSEKNLSTKK